MSQGTGQSYYEIALTNRQVMTIFVVLLLCIVGAFLGGVWLGRDDGSMSASSTQVIAAAPEVGDEAIGELDFFNRDRSAGSTGSTSSTGSAGSEDPAGGAAVTPSEQDAVAGSEQRDRPRRRRRPRDSGAQDQAAGSEEVPVIIEDGGSDRSAPPSTFLEDLTPERVADRVIDAADEPAPSSVAGTGGTGATGSVRISEASAPASATNELVIQVFSSTDEAQARRVVQRLRDGGYPAVLSPVDVEGRTLHRVRIGPYLDPDQAQEVADRVRRAFKLDTWITHGAS